jgi:phosphoglycolate phosphatase
MSNYSILLFDLDGTLTNSKIGITKSVQYALSKFNIIQNELEQLVDFIGPPLVDSFMKYYSFDSITAKQAVMYYREYYERRGMYENELYPNVLQMLESLKDKKDGMIIATSKPTVYARKVLDHFGILNCFADVVGSNLDGTRASKSEVLEHILDRLDLCDKGRIVMIGDRKHDILAANNWNIQSIAVTYGYSSPNEWEEAKPTYFANSIQQLIQLIL